MALAAEADVFIQNYRPGTAVKLGVEYDDVREHNEVIIYCAISAFGQTGPWRNRPGYDLLIQGLSGIMDVTGEPDGPPAKVGLPQTDLITSMWAAFGIVNALYRREQSGEGEYIDLGMLEAALPWLTKQAGKVFAGEMPRRMGSKDPVLAPYQSYETKDGHINIACGNQKLWQERCIAIGREDLLDDPRFETNVDRVDHMEELEELGSELTKRSTEAWTEIFIENAGVPAGPVQNVEDALYNEQTEARGAVSEIERSDRTSVPVIEHPLKFAESTSGFDSPPPQLGEHTEVVFRELGYSEDKLAELRGEGVFGGE